VTYERLANASSEATLTAKLYTHGEMAYEHYTNTRYETTLAAKLNAHGEVAYEWPVTHAMKLCSNDLAVKH